MYKVELHKDGYLIVNTWTGAELATVVDMQEAVEMVRACNREARRFVSAG